MKQTAQLIWQLSKQELKSQYSGSLFGQLWLILQPILLLVVYGLVFAKILGLKWGTEPAHQDMVFYALAIFTGLSLFSATAEILTSSPKTIFSQPNFVKKVRFNLLILPVVTWLKALVPFGFSLLILLLALSFKIELNWAWLAVPFILFPYFIALLGASWLLAALSVYIRDIAQVMPAMSMFLLFLAPIFYPLSKVPESYSILFYLNPMTWPIEALRGALFEGTLPSTAEWFIVYGIGMASVLIGAYTFKVLQRGFADVL
ncbi:ABC transporter permease [Thiomicrorhabdus indica]|uniref:ABC transporter permease n=1 Tax=Thiomicrorhabdus indica TaxID=2267253 RepID=UPI002AA7FF21|nr:ABC transporter permease [Thiomicrorhabdus indica]